MNSKIENRFGKLGIKIPKVLLPSDGVEMQKWSIIACDQFTSEKEYWERIKAIVGDAPSTLNLILPECYLEDGDQEKRVASINSTMARYSDGGTLSMLAPGFILIDRQTEFADSRKGLLLAVDLECYDFSTGSTALIRPTEGTILERLPPRMNIRKGAALDLPHILFLLDDPEGTVIEEAFRHRDEMDLLYNFDLMEDGGHIEGRHVRDPDVLLKILEGFENLLKGRGLLFAVGDGNHSLAAAKSLWEGIKKSGVENGKDHPARYALVEVVNIHDKGLLFEPIHRVLFNIDLSGFMDFLGENAAAVGGSSPDMDTAGDSDSSREFDTVARSHRIRFVSAAGEGTLVVEKDKELLTAEALQEILDRYLSIHSEVSIDYIHGRTTAENLGGKYGNIAFFLPPLNKRTFFEMIEKRGAFPRKTFSLGEAREKRYYLESRLLIE
jgi:hypothetical protein